LYQATASVLLEHGYNAFTFSLLADQMDVSRGVLYKYYENKDELISDYMIHEMERFLLQMNQIGEQASFMDQFEYLLDLIFKQGHIPKIIGISHRVFNSQDQKIQEQKIKLDAQRLEKNVNVTHVSRSSGMIRDKRRRLAE
jgi:AcrR family transcriptional regulator